MTWRGGRSRPTRVVGALGALGWGLLFFGLIDTLVVVVQDESFAWHYLMESGWGLLYLVLVAVPFAASAVRPALRVPAPQVLLVAVSVAVSALLASYPRQLWVALALALSALALAAAAGPPRWAPRRRPDVPLALVAVLAMPGGLAYASGQARNWRTDVAGDITVGLEHGPMQASLGLAVPLVALLAAVAVGTPGGRMPAWTAAATAVWLGLESVAYPDLVGSLGTVGGWAAAGWGMLLLGVAERRVTTARAPARPGRT